MSSLKVKSNDAGGVARLLLLLSVFLSLLPILRIVLIVFSGQNNVSNDTLLVTDTVVRVLSGSYHWVDFPRDSFIDGHFVPFPLALQIIVALFWDWNASVAIGIGLFLTFLSVWIYYRALALLMKSRFKILALPVLSLLFFAIVNLGKLEFEVLAIAGAAYQLGFFLGVWGIVRQGKEGKGFIWALLGGVLASFSYAGGVLVWPVYFVGLILLGGKSRKKLLYLAAGFLFSITPYVYFLLVNPVHGPYETVFPKIKILNIMLMFQGIGWPFTNGYSPSQALIRGEVGIFLLAITLAVLFRLKKKSVAVLPFVPGLMVVLYILMNIYQIAVLRGGFSPWYSYNLILFWVGLVSLIFPLIDTVFNGDIFQQKEIKAYLSLWSFFVLAVVGYFYVTSNLSFQDKSFFLKSRSPVSASCMRNFESAPTYCQSFLFVWPLNRVEELYQRISPLKPAALAAFSPKQEWSLQGDFILGKVIFHESPKIPQIFWTADMSNTAVNFSDYRRLNLFLHSPNSVEWRLKLPKYLNKAIFHTSVAISPSAPISDDSDGVFFEATARVSGHPDQILFRQFMGPKEREWKKFDIPLVGYAGEDLAIILNSKPSGNVNHDWGIFRYPYLELEETKPDSKARLDIDPYVPCNTDLSKDFVQKTKEDWVFPIHETKKWVERNIRSLSDASGGVEFGDIAEDSQLEYSEKMDLCLSDYSHFVIGIALDPRITPRDLQVFFKFNGQNEFQESSSFKIPLLSTPGVREYSFDLKTLERSRTDRINGVRIDPSQFGGLDQESRVVISDIRLIKDPFGTNCQ